MINESSTHAHQKGRSRPARLYLNGKAVGSVCLRGHDGSWGFGDFTPSPEFSAFASVFGRWSLLMHAESAEEPLSPAAAEELRTTESEMDAIRASLILESPDEIRHLTQISIDGPLIEWKEA